MRKWIKLFLTLGNKRKGYANKNITPYMHAAAYHLQDVKQFSGQGEYSMIDNFIYLLP
jgi:hypothetical protein